MLPPNRTPFEFALDATIGEKLDGIPVPIRPLWNPDSCPETLLPWLAWMVGVEEWNPEWTSMQMRQTIKNMPGILRQTGTRAALETALSSLDYDVTVTEWWEQEPKGAPGTFTLSVQVPDGDRIGDATYRQVERIMNRAKNVRSHLAGEIGLSIGGLTQVPTFSAATTGGDITTIYPSGRIGAGDDTRY